MRKNISIKKAIKGTLEAEVLLMRRAKRVEKEIGLLLQALLFLEKLVSILEFLSSPIYPQKAMFQDMRIICRTDWEIF